VGTGKVGKETGLRADHWVRACEVAGSSESRMFLQDYMVSHPIFTAMSASHLT
jgi:hypothetical protein